MKITFLILAFSSTVWAQTTLSGSSQIPSVTNMAVDIDRLLRCGTRAKGLEIIKTDRSQSWQGRLGGAGWEEDGRYFGVTLSIRKEGTQCFVEVSSRERTMKFEFWVGSDLSELKALSGPGLSESDRNCSVDLMYKISLSDCSYPVKIIGERPPKARSLTHDCEIVSYEPVRAAEIDFVAENSENVCIGKTYCIPKIGGHGIRLDLPPYYSWVGCLPASNGECLQSFENCGDDEHAYPRNENASQKIRQRLGLPPRSRGQR